jgi:hypothetical protein
MVALESTFDAGAAAGMRAIYELRLGDERFAIHVEHGTIEITRGAPPRPDGRATDLASANRLRPHGWCRHQPL